MSHMKACEHAQVMGFICLVMRYLEILTFNPEIGESALILR